MKKYIKYALRCGIFSLMFVAVSCESYLDKEPGSIISGDQAFKNFQNFQGFTEELYNCVPDFGKSNYRPCFNWGEDEVSSTSDMSPIGNNIDNGDFRALLNNYNSWLDRSNSNTGNTFDQKSLWRSGWYGINKANLGLANLNKMTDATAEERRVIAGQLLFFRAWFHFEMMQFWGGLPYIDKVYQPGETVNLERLKYKDCAEKVARDFRAAADSLPIDWDKTEVGLKTKNKNRYRMNKIMALGYLGKNYLWAASPLMNSESTGSKAYNVEFCKKAADAFTEVLRLIESNQTQYALVPKATYFSATANVFYTVQKNWEVPGSTESIFIGHQYAMNNTNYSYSRSFQTSILQAEASLTFAPTANYVNYYGMANGMPIKDLTKADPESGYDPQYPWKNRDPRFYKDFVFDGVKIVQGSTTDEPNRYGNLYTGGSFRNVSTGSRTGYLLYKFIPIKANKHDNGSNYASNLTVAHSYMRVSDLYLMYAEAAAQATGSATAKFVPSDNNVFKSAEEALNIVRDRAGVGQVASKFLGSLDNFMSEVRRDRAVELAYEGHRFTDLRRWLLLTEYPYTIKTSVEFDRAAPLNTSIDPKLNKVNNLSEKVIVERIFTSKHYWLPLKNEDCQIDINFKQNPGW